MTTLFTVDCPRDGLPSGFWVIFPGFLRALGVNILTQGIVKPITRSQLVEMLAPVYREFVEHPQGLSRQTLSNSIGRMFHEWTIETELPDGVVRVIMAEIETLKAF